MLLSDMRGRRKCKEHGKANIEVSIHANRFPLLGIQYEKDNVVSCLLLCPIVLSCAELDDAGSCLRCWGEASE